MSFPIEQVLGFVPLMQVIEAVRPGIPNPLPASFMTVTDRVEGDRALLTRTYGQRKLANRIPYGSPPVQTVQQKIDEIPVILPSYGNTIRMDPNVLVKLRSLDAYEFNRGKQMVALQMKSFVQRFVNTRVAAAFSMLVNGKLWYDTDGELLPSSSGADASKTIDAAVLASHQGQIALDTGGADIIDVSWSTASANILTHINKIKLAALKSTGRPLKYAFYGMNIPRYMADNDDVRYFLARDGKMDSEYLRGGTIPNGLFDLTWIPFWEAFFEDSDETNQNLMGADNVVFAPEPDGDWWGYVEGSTPTPTTIDVQADMTAALNSLEFKTGMYAYAHVTMAPAGIEMVHGDCNLPWLKAPDSIFQVDTVL